MRANRPGSGPGSRRSFGRKGQAATEYLYTYGWIFLTVIVVGGVLIYFNVTKARTIIPVDCSLFAGLECLDSSVDETLLSIEIVNGLGFAIGNITMNITGTCNSSANTSDINPYGNINVMLANKQARFTFECQNLTNMKIAERIQIGYINVESGQPHSKVGKLEYLPVGQ